MAQGGVRDKKELSKSLRLAALFLVAFVIPVVIGAFGFRLLYEKPIKKDELDAVFGPAPIFSGRGSYLRVKHAQDLDPLRGQDFLLVVWLKLSRALPLDVRQVMLSKFEAKTPAKSGYALALTQKNNGGVLPEIYWRDSAGRGRWYAFEELKALPNSWFMLALSFRNNRSLGLHIWPIERDGKRRVRILGGHQFDQDVIPNSTEDLLVGGFQSDAIYGRIGPLGIFQKVNLSAGFDEVIGEIIDDPLNVPSSLRGASTKFWCVDGKSDSGDFKHIVEFTGGPGAGKRERKRDGAR